MPGLMDYGTIGPIEDPPGLGGIFSKTLRAYGGLLGGAGGAATSLGNRLGNVPFPLAQLGGRGLASVGQGLSGSGQAFTDWSQGYSPIQSTGNLTQPLVNPQQMLNIAGGLMAGYPFARAVPGAVGDAWADFAAAAGRPPSFMTAYHGTPHIFPPTEDNPLGAFDLSKVGTGEGAQAYGHGIYVAEDPKVAGIYRTALNDWKPKGVDIEPGSVQDRAAAYAAEQIDAGAQNPALSAARNAEKFLKDDVAFGQKNKLGMTSQQQAIVDQLYDWHRSGQEFERGGTVYHIDLPDEHIEHMLDWDKPIAQQSEPVRQALAQAGLWNENAYQKWKSASDQLDELASRPATWHAANKDTANALYDQLQQQRRLAGSEVAQTSLIPRLTNWQTATGEGLYKELGRTLESAHPTISGPDPAASAHLRALGVPGLKYLDAGSRAAGEGSRNFVLFDPSIAKIIKRE